MTIELIDTGYFYADGGAMFGAIPKAAWSRRYPSNDKNSCVLAMRSALVKTDDGHIILIDTGAGQKHLKLLGYYSFFQLTDLREELKKRQVSPHEVTDIVLTHLHFDHCGDCTRHAIDSNSIVMNFPNATHWVSQAQWENFLHPNPLEKDSYFLENMQAVVEAGKLQLIDTDMTICDSIELRIYNGHTIGQLVPYLHTDRQTFVFAGDVIPLLASISPEWISAYDTCPLVSYDEKVRMLEEASREHQALIYCHDAYTQCTSVKKTRDFYHKDQNISSELLSLAPVFKNL